MERGNQQRGSSFGQEPKESSRQQESINQDVSSADQNSQRGNAWENYRTRELSGGQQRQEGEEGRSEEQSGERGNLEQNDMD